MATMNFVIRIMLCGCFAMWMQNAWALPTSMFVVSLLDDYVARLSK